MMEVSGFFLGWFDTSNAGTSLFFVSRRNGMPTSTYCLFYFLVFYFYVIDFLRYLVWLNFSHSVKKCNVFPIKNSAFVFFHATSYDF